jgi:hypothetical protein
LEEEKMQPHDSRKSPEYLLDSVDKNDLPRERLRNLGSSALKTEELIAIILRTGTPGEHVLHLSERLLKECGGLAGLARLPFSELLDIPVEEFQRKASGMAQLNLVQQGAELAYLLLHDPQFRSVRREHLLAAGKRIPLKQNIELLYKILDNGIGHFLHC